MLSGAVLVLVLSVWSLVLLALSQILLALFFWWGCGGGGHVTLLSGRHHTPQGPSVEDQHGGAPLQTRVSSLALPVAVAGLAEGHVAVGVVVAERMFLAAIYIFRPVAGVGVLIVQQTANAELFRSCSIPASPVPGAGGLVAEDAVQPVAVLCPDGRIDLNLRVLAVVGPPRVVASLRHSSVFASEDQAVGTVVLDGLSIVTLPVFVAVLVISHYS